MRRLSAIAALLMLVLMSMPPRACAMISHSVKAEHDCCEHAGPVVECGGMSTNLCCAVQGPVDATPYPVQSAMSLVLPSATVAVVYENRSDSLRPSRLALGFPVQHSPPGLVIATTTVLRI
jgi:hypothetical protein